MTHAFHPEASRPVLLDDVARSLGLRRQGGWSVDDAVGGDAVVGGWSVDDAVVGVALSTADVRPGVLFAALPGRHGHGADHSDAARSAGAVAVLTDPDGEAAAHRSGLPVLVVPDPRSRLGDVARLTSGTATLPFPVFGVTGTNGKTSTVHLLDALMRRLGWRTALSSTVERRVLDVAVPSALTTPEAPELHEFLARAAEQGVQGAALEVSAQGLSRHRTDGVVVDVAGFTNLSHDHLDDYPDMDAYLAAKAMLFTPARSRAGVVSLDSAAGRWIAASATVPVTTISTDPDAGADWVVRVLEQRPDGTRAAVTAPDGTVFGLDVPLLGVHMVANAGLALAMLAVAGVPTAALRDATSGPLEVEVPGRMADASAATGPRVYVDFAHTPDAFEKSLVAIRAFATGRVAIVLGADGDRDRSKRRAMGAVAAGWADVVVVADHHPRFEAPGPIRRAILDGANGVAHGALVLEVPDPARAVRRALDEVGDDGVVYWAGPGLTDYRDVAGAHVPYSSFEDARAALAELGHVPGQRHDREPVGAK
ncbi:UDP-N-acetylmuramoyl-L-alanyl-D-glutamate--2,6-diaminopimelate ligase [Curtobacterium sp. MCPF17_002]|uniref:Mur ligase family protein n=1 Tax=Curtobacterium sp. MCPF17_002 TaxID=2175645 RepID=UPI000DA80334|nr:UDP-N-acetylmuramoyl-L-alanyl-D-glutamate--2,6-diaminopimelate ligase [Curtobacterium sp. MCPF17_002]WIB76913.1 UDP-N-acetylmuramoyl-L-alanyl-D-glutamate--2,6-diaminopimelate ligase [Curtobacterium sp. MCPF17_002]